jgi:sulfoxide reductase catalytic subunit YedY
MLVKVPKGWEIPEREATPESVYLNRRKFLGSLGVAGVYTLALMSGCAKFGEKEPPTQPASAWPLSEAEKSVYPAPRNPEFVLDRPITDEAVAAHYNNFYEFSSSKDNVWKKVEGFVTRPWQVEVTGLVEKPMVFDPDDLIRRMPMEERLYRLRCVEAWAMAVPWTGSPMKAFIDHVQPLSKARFVKFITVQLNKTGDFFSFGYPWPYTEGLTMEEALNPLTLLVTGIYGHPLPKQHGAPLRLVVPWKYGYKNIKSIVQIEFTDRQPATFWNTVAPDEYDFWANVNPKVPHPRWSQETERMIGTNERRSTLLYNGYGQYVAHLYA